MVNYYDNMVRVAIMVTTGGKRIYMLVKDADGSNENIYHVLSTPSGAPRMWTNKKDMIAYAKKMGLRIAEGYRFLGGQSWGRGPVWE